MSGGDVDPYAQYTGDEVDIHTGTHGGDVDVDGNLVDPPDLGAGTEGGFINMESDNKNRNNAELDDGEDLEAMDSKGP